MKVIDVDDSGMPIDGAPLMTASGMAVRNGFMVNVPVLLRYPNGETVESVEGRITEKGLAVAAAEMSKGEPRH